VALDERGDGALYEVCTGLLGRTSVVRHGCDEPARRAMLCDTALEAAHRLAPEGPPRALLPGAVGGTGTQVV